MPSTPAINVPVDSSSIQVDLESGSVTRNATSEPQSNGKGLQFEPGAHAVLIGFEDLLELNGKHCILLEYHQWQK